MIDADERERQVVQLLETWPSRLSGVLVGGYAVAAYGTPRYSVDVDIVVPSASSEDWIAWLAAHHLISKSANRVSLLGETPVAVQRWGYRNITLDLMIGGVRDRDSGVTIPEEWLLQGPSLTRLELLSGPLVRPVSAVRIEGLWATKLLAGRPHDLTDLFSVMGQKVDLVEVRELFERYSGAAAKSKFRFVLDRTRDPKTYVDTLSRLMQGRPESQANRIRWDRFTKMVESAMPRATREPA